MQCYRHKKVETNVRCGKCEKPICPKCMIPGPAGMRCPDCASLRSTALYQIHPARLVVATIAALIVGYLGAYVMQFTFFWTLFAAPVFGGVVAEVVLRASGRKRGPILEFIGVGSIVIGYLIAVVIPMIMGLFATHAAGSTAIGTAVGVGFSVWQIIGAALAISACYGRLKYL